MRWGKVSHLTSGQANSGKHPSLSAEAMEEKSKEKCQSVFHKTWEFYVKLGTTIKLYYLSDAFCEREKRGMRAFLKEGRGYALANVYFWYSRKANITKGPPETLYENSIVFWYCLSLKIGKRGCNVGKHQDVEEWGWKRVFTRTKQFKWNIISVFRIFSFPTPIPIGWGSLFFLHVEQPQPFHYFFPHGWLHTFPRVNLEVLKFSRGLFPFWSNAASIWSYV